ncbi:Uncharacterized protein DAT39_000071 [Clarias magur]|uniref:Uncharacterized protein n=1 Tax=Clarias magur TaxID=1594786 RepID=A0A8J4XHE9_CLAMG|nr:Uncharacterized protein DAT39_000071 [Clarias magur]
MNDLQCETFQGTIPLLPQWISGYAAFCLLPGGWAGVGWDATSCSGLEVTPGPINRSNRQQPKHISQMKHLFCSASEPLHSPPSISLLPLFFIRLLMVYKLHIMVPPLPCTKAFFYGLSAFVREKSYKWEPAAEAVKL